MSDVFESVSRERERVMGDVLAVVEQREGKVRGISNEVVSAATELANGLGGSVHALLIGGEGSSDRQSS